MTPAIILDVLIAALLIAAALRGCWRGLFLSLSGILVLIAAMIGARGLGGEVWKAIQRLQVGSGFEAGLGIVIVAITLDRLFRALARKSAGRTR